MARGGVFVAPSVREGELEDRVEELEKAVRKVVRFAHPYSNHNIFCTDYWKKGDTCSCGLADLRALIGEKNG